MNKFIKWIPIIGPVVSIVVGVGSLIFAGMTYSKQEKIAKIQGYHAGVGYADEQEAIRQSKEETQKKIKQK